MRYPYIIVDNNNDNIHETLHKLERFPDYYWAGTARSNEEGLDMILEVQPAMVFITLNASNAKNEISLLLMAMLHQYLNVLPHFVVLAESQEFAYNAIKAGVFDYLLKPLRDIDLTKCMLRIEKSRAGAPAPQQSVASVPDVAEAIREVTIEPGAPHQICIKSYGDYQFISLNDVIYLKADNNTTDFFLNSGRKLTAYKTLKHYENNLPANFYRIHNSYIVNSSFVTRISTGKSLCFLNGNDLSVSFSKTYKENIDNLIKDISDEYL